MPYKSGKCIDCGNPTKTSIALRCRACFRKNCKEIGDNPKSFKKVAKCFLCGNLNNLNQSQQRIWDLKEKIAFLKEAYEAEMNRWHILRNINEQQDKKNQRVVAYKYKVYSETSKRLSELKNFAISLDSRIKG